jgi:DHA1 family multidrug resistance protein-like MFS transporter
LPDPQRAGALKALYVSSFFFNLGAAMALLTVTFYAIELGATPLELGIIGMVWPAIFSVSAMISGPLSDRTSRRLLPILGSLIACLTFLLVPSASNPFHLMLLGLPAGVAFSMVWPPVEAWVAESSSPHNMRRNVGLFNLSWSIGAAPGPFLSGLTFGGGVATPLTVSIILIALAGLILLVRAPRPVAPTSHSGPVEPDNSTGYLHLAWVVNFATYFTIGVLRSLFPKLGEQLGMGTASVGALLSLVTVSQVVTFGVLARTSRWHYRLIPLIGSQFSLLLCCLLVYSLSGVTELSPVMVLIGACTGLSYNSSIYYSLNTLGGKGARSGIHEALIGTGIVAGPLFGGIAAQQWGLRAPYLLAAGVIAVGIMATLVFASRIRMRGRDPVGGQRRGME